MVFSIQHRAIRRVAVLNACIVVAVAILILAGHAADVDRLRRGLVGEIAVRPQAAAALLSLGSGLLVRRAATSRLLGAVAVLVSGATLLDWAIGAHPGIDALLFDGAASMRMSMPAAASSLLGGAALLAARRRWLGQALGATAGFVAVLGVVAHAYGGTLHPGAPMSPVTLPAAALLALWSAAYLLSVSDSGPLALFRAGDEWSSFAWRTAAMTLLGPLVFGALTLSGAETGLYDEPFAVALIVTTTTFALLIASVRLIARVRRTAALYRTIVESAHDGIGLVGADLRLQLVNERFASMLGYQAAELRGLGIGNLVAGADMPELLERAARRDADGTATHTEVRLRRRDGSELPVLSAASRVTAPDGTTTGTVIILTDISGRIRAEEARRASEARFRRLYEANVIGVAFWDDGGVVYDANDEMLRIFGVSRDEIPGWRWREQHTSTGELAHRKTIDELRTTGRSALFENEYVRPDGARMWVQVVAARLDDDRNIAFVSDVTEREEARQSLERAHDILAARVAALEGVDAVGVAHERAHVEVLARRLATATEELETFSYSVSHDLRAPLRAIDGFSRELLLKLEPQLDEESRRYLGRVRAATQRMSRLIDDLLDLSRLSRRPMSRTAIDVSALAAEVAAELGARHVRIQPGLAAVADAHLLRVVLQNLIGNAVKFSSRGAEPRVEVFAAGDGAIAVRDNGVGFDMQYAQKIFAPFQRLHPASEFEGTGIGLALVQRIVARHGGSIRAESAPYRGATFYLTLGDPRS